LRGEGQGEGEDTKILKGVYVIIASLPQPAIIQPGDRRKMFRLDRAFYAYVGSALNGLEARIARHLSASKKHHWHIDYLLDRADVCTAIYAETGAKEECLIAWALSRNLPSVPHFGCSDCSCSSHLFFTASYQELREMVFDSFKRRNLVPCEWKHSQNRQLVV
jgi:Uri superfamily endonuclease